MTVLLQDQCSIQKYCITVCLLKHVFNIDCFKRQVEHYDLALS